jgi:U3 small nucleolar RNA-associated protein 12
MVKAYFDYVQSHMFGLSNKNRSNAVFRKSQEQIIIGCAELVLVMNLKSGEVVRRIDNKKKEYVSYLQLFEDGYLETLAVGYEDGDIAVCQLNEAIERLDEEEFFTFSEHESAVQCIRFNEAGSLLLSSSQQNSLVLWDLVGRIPLHKFTGHAAPITCLSFYKNFKETTEYILSSSKDGCLRVWDIDTKHCVDVITSKKNEVLGIIKIEGLKFVRNELFMASTNSEELIFYEMKVNKKEGETVKKYNEERGRFTRHFYSLVVQMESAQELGLIVLLNDDKGIEFLKIRNKQEVSNKYKRKMKRLAEKDEKTAEEDKKLKKAEEVVAVTKDEYMEDVANWFEFAKLHKLVQKANAIKFIPQFKHLKNLLVIFYVNNSYEVRQIIQGENGEISLAEIVTFDHLAHQSVVRTTCFSPDDSMLLSASSETVKVWSSLQSFQNIRTIAVNDVIASTFLNYQKFAVLGTRTGTLMIINTQNGEIEYTGEKAHSNTIWNIDTAVINNEIVIVSGSSDGFVRFWSLREKVSSKKITLELIKSVEMGEPVQWVKFSASKVHYAAALMDNSIQIRYFDSDKLFISLYGHKMPVLSIDYSSDDTLIVSGSSDKYITDLGDRFRRLPCSHPRTFLSCHPSQVRQGHPLHLLDWERRGVEVLGCGPKDLGEGVQHQRQRHLDLVDKLVGRHGGDVGEGEDPAMPQAVQRTDIRAFGGG